MKSNFELAVQNIIKHGDTDIFPLPFENHVLFDSKNDVVTTLLEYHSNFESCLTRFPPAHVNSLTPLSYTGFRWATQLDPIWNAYFLGCVLGIAQSIEEARIKKDERIIFSYRYQPDSSNGDLFDHNFGWVQFMQQSEELSKDYAYVVVCDISEFYPRLGHHRLENALLHLNDAGDLPSRIITFLDNFSNGRSFGIPIGGPAARILSELTMNQIDRLLYHQDFRFVRFADDFHLFTQSHEDAYTHPFFY